VHDCVVLGEFVCMIVLQGTVCVRR